MDTLSIMIDSAVVVQCSEDKGLKSKYTVNILWVMKYKQVIGKVEQ